MTMKKFLSMLLVLTMVLAIAGGAMAACKFKKGDWVEFKCDSNAYDAAKSSKKTNNVVAKGSVAQVRCVSGKCATGLMQIQPHTAGQEVASFLRDRPGAGGQQDLFSPEQNIRYGAAYLHILATRYFGQVTDPLSREFCVITAYNSGPGRFYGYFGKSRKEAFARLGCHQLVQFRILRESVLERHQARTHFQEPVTGINVRNIRQLLI